MPHATEAESSTLQNVSQASETHRWAMRRRNEMIRSAARAGHSYAAIARAAGLSREQIRRIALRLTRTGAPRPENTDS